MNTVLSSTGARNWTYYVPAGKAGWGQHKNYGSGVYAGSKKGPGTIYFTYGNNESRAYNIFLMSL